MKTKFRLIALLLSAVIFLGFIGCDIPINDQFNVHVSLENKEDEENPASTYSITIDGDLKKGTVTASKTDGIKENELVTLTITPEEGYRVATLTVKNDKEEVLVVNNHTFTMPAGDVKVSVVFEDAFFNGGKCTVNFNTDGGSEVESQSVIIGHTVVKPYPPTKKGFTFSGWYNGNTIFDFESEITSDITLTAKWTSANCITVTVLPNSKINVKSEETKTGLILTADEGYTDYNWNFDGKPASQIPDIEVNGNILKIYKKDTVITAGVAYQVSLNAIKDNILYGTELSVKRNFHKVGFNPNAGSWFIDPLPDVYIPDGNPVIIPGVPALRQTKTEKYIFDGWYTTTMYTEKIDLNAPITKDTTFYAKWKIIKLYNVEIDNSYVHGTVSVDKASEIEEGEIVTLTVIPDKYAGPATVTVKSDFGEVQVENNSFKMPPSDVTVNVNFSWSYIGMKAPLEEKEVCDIVFTDGSATTYKRKMKLSDEQIASAIAVIFYKGNELNNDGDTTTVRTIGVGLKGADKIAVTNGNAANVNITTIQSDVKNGSFNIERISAFLRNNDIPDDTDDPLKYPAFYFSKEYTKNFKRIIGTEFEDGWFFPSYAEMDQYLKKNHYGYAGTVSGFEIGFAETVLHGQGLFNCDTYWTSTQHETAAKEFITTYERNVKSHGYYVLAFRDF